MLQVRVEVFVIVGQRELLVRQGRGKGRGAKERGCQLKEG